jgi:hypothetical protein
MRQNGQEPWPFYEVLANKHDVTRFRLLTSSLRCLPDFLIVGAMKCGTTSLYRYLIGHPCVAPALKKQVYFFSNDYQKGLGWYRAHFPTVLGRYRARIWNKQLCITGEASPSYLLHPHIPRRIWKAMPYVRLIAVLRNPVDRAYSHYYQCVRDHHEPLSFEEAIEQEPERIRGEWERMMADEWYRGPKYGRYAYLARGIYVDQLQRFEAFFPKKQILVVKSEELYEHPVETFDRVTAFLNLPRWQPKEFSRENTGDYTQPMQEGTRKRLIEHFRAHNQRLYDYLGVDFGWDR